MNGLKLQVVDSLPEVQRCASCHEVLGFAQRVYCAECMAMYRHYCKREEQAVAEHRRMQQLGAERQQMGIAQHAPEPGVPLWLMAVVFAAFALIAYGMDGVWRVRT